jgi:CRISPR/Cas system-associated exonuclease Cas4 (RecB family)
MITPQEFIKLVNGSLHATYDKALEKSTGEWETRNSGDTISGSAFSKCIRLCYYRWFDEEHRRQTKDPVFTDKLNEQSRRNMYFGLLAEDILIKSLEQFSLPGKGTVHKAQDSPPVVVTDTVEGITRSAANDMVLEFEDETEGQYFIPTECKTTDRAYGFKDKATGKWITPQTWWDRFTGYDEHKRQVLQWIWLAKKNGMNIPFGCLFYLRRATWETKYIIIDSNQSSYWDIEGASEIIDYTVYAPYLDHRNEQLVHSITTETEPPYDPGVPDIICKNCNYLKQCKETR